MTIVVFPLLCYSERFEIAIKHHQLLRRTDNCLRGAQCDKMMVDDPFNNTLIIHPICYYSLQKGTWLSDIPITRSFALSLALPGGSITQATFVSYGWLHLLNRA